MTIDSAGSAGGADSAARRYKDIVAGLDAAAGTALARDGVRAAELADQLGRSDTALRRGGDQAALTRAGVALRWEAAVEALWAERWFRLRPPPAPDRTARPEHVEALDRTVEEAYESLIAAIRRRRWSLRRN